jgi:hypothetical protein
MVFEDSVTFLPIYATLYFSSWKSSARLREPLTSLIFSSYSLQGFRPRDLFRSSSESRNLLMGRSWPCFPTWLIFHNSMWQSVCVHSPKMYQFISVILNFLHNWVKFKF